MKDTVVISAVRSNKVAFERLAARPVRRYGGKPARLVVSTRTMDGRLYGASRADNRPAP